MDTHIAAAANTQLCILTRFRLVTIYLLTKFTRLARQISKILRPLDYYDQVKGSHSFSDLS